MGLTAASVGRGAVENHKKQTAKGAKWTVALAGNPNVGKSTVFNALTGMHQHTGNWSGKTVTNAVGFTEYHSQTIRLVDVPGCYSLLTHSPEEDVARDLLCFSRHQATIVVCDATCLERNMNLVLQIIELTPRVVVCVNLLDEARHKHIELNLDLLSDRLGVPVVGCEARRRRGLGALLGAVEKVCQEAPKNAIQMVYPAPVEEAIALVEPAMRAVFPQFSSSRWLALRLLEDNAHMHHSIEQQLSVSLSDHPALQQAIGFAREFLQNKGISTAALSDQIVSALVGGGAAVCQGVIHTKTADANRRDRRIDNIVTGKWTAFPIMLLLLTLVFWITMVGANYPSGLLQQMFNSLERPFFSLLQHMHLPLWCCDMIVGGIYRVLTWVVAVMLPPMAIFFPLFTLLEDLGYLPRVAFNLDRCFQKCRACGKQSLCMMMGFGCNAAGVVGCRIIDSPRERLIAILTNCFVPCNGRFPTMVTLLTLFFVSSGFFGSGAAAIGLAALIVLGIVMTLVVSRILSATLLKGVPSSFTLELPPYRTPQIGQVLLRSVVDRTLFVLGRAVAVAAPAGLVIWLFANVTVGDGTLLSQTAAFLDPVARFFGLDGTILLAFILGIPANEIVLPLIIMAYTAGGTLVEMTDLSALRELLTANHWTPVTALCVLLFCLMHWPCATTLMTIKKETGSIKWTLLAFAIPTVAGLICCALVAQGARLLL